MQEIANVASITTETWVLAVVLALVAGAAYNWLVGQVLKVRPWFPGSILYIILGAISLAIALLLVPAIYVAIVALMVIGTGVPNLFGDVLRSHEGERLAHEREREQDVLRASEKAMEAVREYTSGGARSN